MKKRLLAMLLVLGLVVSGLPGTAAFAEEEAGTGKQEAVQEETVKAPAPEKKAEPEAKKENAAPQEKAAEKPAPEKPEAEGAEEKPAEETAAKPQEPAKEAPAKEKQEPVKETPAETEEVPAQEIHETSPEEAPAEEKGAPEEIPAEGGDGQKEIPAVTEPVNDVPEEEISQEPAGLAEKVYLRAPLNEITSLDIKVNSLPKYGQNQNLKPDLTITGDGIKSSRAYYSSHHGYSTGSDEFTFESGKTYFVHISVEAEDGYIFKKGGNANGVDPGWVFDGTCNMSGESATFSKAVVASYYEGSELIVWLSLKAEKRTWKDIENVALRFARPKAGDKASEVSAVSRAEITSDPNCIITGARWYDHEPADDFFGAPEAEFAGTFKAGKTYYAMIDMTPKDGYRLLQGGEHYYDSDPTGLSVKGARSRREFLDVINYTDTDGNLYQYGRAVVSFTPYRTGYDKDVWIDNTVDKSVSYIDGYVNLKGSGGIQAGMDPEQKVYSAQESVQFSVPRTEKVQKDINDATYAARGVTEGIRKYGKDGEFHLSTTERTGKVWDHRVYDTDAMVTDGLWIEAPIQVKSVSEDTYEDTAGNTYTPTDYRISRTHVASGEYGKETFFEVRSDGWVSGYDITVTDDGDGKGQADLSASLKEGTVTLTAQPNEGYRFKKWKVVSGGAELADTSSSTTTFTMPGSDVEVKALFECIHGHGLQHHDRVSPTCEADGTEEYWSCDVCGRLFADEAGTERIDEPAVISTTGHAWDDGILTKEPGCEEKGIMTYTCKDDPSHTKTEEVDALGHDWDEGTVQKEATCEEDGSILYVCSRCQKTRTKAIPATGHDWGKWEVVKEATSSKAGTKERICKNDPEHKETKKYTLKKSGSGSSGSGKTSKKSQTGSSGTTKAKRGARTDDGSSAGVWLILLTVSLAGAALVLSGRKRLVK